MRSLLALFVPTMLAWTPQPASAQAFVPPAGVQCLTRTYTDASGNLQPLAIFVLAGESATYQGLGFVPGGCGTMSLTAFRGETCRIARLGNEAVQAQLTRILGARPQDLCDSAKRAAPYPAAAADE